MNFASPPARLAASAALACLGGCGALMTTPTPPSVVVPDSLRAPADETLLRTLAAVGVQIYECRAEASEAAATDWVFVAPEARLFDVGGVQVGKHYAGPTWEAMDGSKVVGVVKARVDAPQAGAIPWLLLATRSAGPAGKFAKVTSVQRVATVGGAAPATGCTPATVGQQARVPYKAEYTQYVTTF